MPGFGWGHVSDMNKRLKANRDMRHSKNMFSNKSGKLSSNKKKIIVELPTDEEFIQIRAKIQNRKREAKLRFYFVLFIALFLTFLLLKLIWFYAQNTEFHTSV